MSVKGTNLRRVGKKRGRKTANVTVAGTRHSRKSVGKLKNNTKDRPPRPETISLRLSETEKRGHPDKKLVARKQTRGTGRALPNHAFLPEVETDSELQGERISRQRRQKGKSAVGSRLNSERRRKDSKKTEGKSHLPRASGQRSGQEGGVGESELLDPPPEPPSEKKGMNGEGSWTTMPTENGMDGGEGEFFSKADFAMKEVRGRGKRDENRGDLGGMATTHQVKWGGKKNQSLLSSTTVAPRE